FKSPEHWFYVCPEMRTGFCLVSAEYPIVQVEGTLFAPERIGQVHIITNVQRDVVVVDGIAHKPVEPGISVVGIGTVAQPSVRHVDEPVWYPDTDQHAVHLVR